MVALETETKNEIQTQNQIKEQVKSSFRYYIQANKKERDGYINILKKHNLLKDFLDIEFLDSKNEPHGIIHEIIKQGFDKIKCLELIYELILLGANINYNSVRSAERIKRIELTNGGNFKYSMSDFIVELFSTVNTIEINNKFYTKNKINRIREIFEKIILKTFEKNLDKDSHKRPSWGVFHLIVSCIADNHRKSFAIIKNESKAIELIDIAKKNGYNINELDEIDESVFFLACWFHNVNIIEYMLKNEKINFDHKTLGGRDFINFLYRDSENFISNKNNFEKIILLAIKHGFDINKFKIESEKYYRKAEESLSPDEFLHFKSVMDKIYLDKNLKSLNKDSITDNVTVKNKTSFI